MDKAIDMSKHDLILDELRCAFDAVKQARRVIGFALNGLQPNTQFAALVLANFESTVPMGPSAKEVCDALRSLALGNKRDRDSVSKTFEIANDLVCKHQTLLQDYSCNTSFKRLK